MNIYDYLAQEAALHLAKVGGKITDGKWFESLVAKLTIELQQSELDNPTRAASLAALDLLNKNKNLVVGLGLHSFTLLTYQVSAGKNSAALDSYIKALGNPDELIALMNSGTDGVIKAKKQLDQLHKNAMQLVIDILGTGAKLLLPFLLASI